MQIKKINKIYNETFLVGGGYKNALSLKDLTSISQKLTNIKIKINKKKKTFVYDIPYFVSSNLKISKKYDWKPKRTIINIATDIFNWQKKNFKLLTRVFD